MHISARSRPCKISTEPKFTIIFMWLAFGKRLIRSAASCIVWPDMQRPLLWIRFPNKQKINDNFHSLAFSPPALCLTVYEIASQIDFGQFHEKIITNQIIVVESCRGSSSSAQTTTNIIVDWWTKIVPVRAHSIISVEFLSVNQKARAKKSTIEFKERETNELTEQFNNWCQISKQEKSYFN